MRDGEVLVTDGPFSEAAEVVGGLYVLDADDIDAAVALAALIPVNPGGAVEVRPVADMGGGRAPEPGLIRGTAMSDARSEVERTFRAESGRALATLARLLGDVDAAEDAVQEAFVEALRTWPGTGRARPTRRVDHHDGPQPRARPPAPGAGAARPASRRRGRGRPSPSPRGRPVRRPTRGRPTR